jgi:hypothetical protein
MSGRDHGSNTMQTTNTNTPSNNGEDRRQALIRELKAIALRIAIIVVKFVLKICEGLF